MKGLEDLIKDINLIDSIDWDLDPAVAVGRHLEWGAGWATNDARPDGSSEVSVYFAVNTWEDPPVIVLIKRVGFDMEELASFRMPEDIETRFLKSVGYHKAMYGIEGEIKNWLINKFKIH